MDEIIKQVSNFLRTHSHTICLAWTAAMLTIYGNHLTRFAKQTAKGWHITIRLTFFILFWGLGVGLLTVFISSTLQAQVLKLSNNLIILIILAAFTIIGILADRKNQL